MIGIIANPASGKDIRRLVSQGTVFDNMEKVNIIQRILAALYCSGINEIYAMPDSFQIVPKAAERLKRNFEIDMKVNELKIKIYNNKSDSIQAAEQLKNMGASSIITLGGDGTNRAVAKSCGSVPLIPLSTGTNNVFPVMIEGTVAGLAAAVVETDVEKKYVKSKKKKIIKVYKNDEMVDIALIDAVITDDQFIGSRAIWDPKHIKEIMVTQANADSIGMSVIPGSFYPISEDAPYGFYLKIGSEFILQTYAAIAPGILKNIKIESYKEVQFDQPLKIETESGMIALDGEREIAFKEKDEISLEISPDGPFVINIKQTLNNAAKNEFFQRGCFVKNPVNL